MKSLAILLTIFLSGCTKAAFIGDSLTYLMGPLPDGEVNLAVPGYTTAQMHAIESPQLAALTPLAVVILGGTNDLFQGLDSVDELEAMALEARTGGSCVILATVPHSLYLDPALVDAFNAKVLFMASVNHFPVADYARVLTLDLLFDGLHPNPAGALAMQALVQPLIDSCPNVIAARGP